jgi:RHS repeat-associated protein
VNDVGSQRIALRENTDGVGAVYFFLADHLGSTAVTVDSEGNLLHELRYKPFGGVYYTTPGGSSTPTDYRYTGQRLEESLGLYDYKARYYDPVLRRFIQPDTIVPEPGNPLTFDGFLYGFNGVCAADWRLYTSTTR